jgi:CP family cyanate transporter-like MFS transporter
MSEVQTTRQQASSTWLTRWWLVLGVVTVATALRPLVVTVGPVLPDLRQDLDLGAASAALLTALPVACFGVGAFAGPALSRRLGIDTALTAAMALLVLGAVLRVLGGTAWLFAGTVLVGAAIAVANVLLPALVRRDFPTRVGVVTGIYTSTVAITSTLAALVAVPLADVTGAGWRGPFLGWGLAAAAALLVWLAHLRTSSRVPHASTAAAAPAFGLLRSPTALGLTVFMGLQSIGFYVLVAWLPSLLQDSGLTPTAAGALLSLASFLGIPAGLLAPILAGRVGQQSALAVGATALTAAGWLGLLLAPETAPALWVVLLGLGTGSSFPIALVLIGLRSSSPTVTPQLSAVVQGVGYLIAATGPLLVGLLRDTSGGWTVPLIALLVLTVAQGVSGWAAGRARTV